MVDVKSGDDRTVNQPRARTMRDSLDDALEAAADLAARLRESAEDVGEMAGDQVARVVKTAEELRDRTLSERALAAARHRPFLASLRRSGHDALDLGFDLAGVAVDTGLDGLDRLLRRRTPQGDKPTLRQA